MVNISDVLVRGIDALGIEWINATEERRAAIENDLRGMSLIVSRTEAGNLLIAIPRLFCERAKEPEQKKCPTCGASMNACGTPISEDEEDGGEFYWNCPACGLIQFQD